MTAVKYAKMIVGHGKFSLKSEFVKHLTNIKQKRKKKFDLLQL